MTSGFLYYTGPDSPAQDIFRLILDGNFGTAVAAELAALDQFKPASAAETAPGLPARNRKLFFRLR